ncbi:hypothetical protein SASPL_133807 [Salvia splendens]|uniref:F-box domain-containing protein n=1 Tax=Salvia splendens TaxID=180675 RepID=A0A8X8X3R5_SALSN|nr:hypothetical protein SASPL_133807 [Salvia splendens]
MLSMGTKSESSDPIPPIPAELPEDLTTNILQRLGEGERLESAQLVCSKWWRVCKNPAIGSQPGTTSPAKARWFSRDYWAPKLRSRTIRWSVLDGIPDIKVFKLRHSSGFMWLKGSRA